MKKVLKTLAVLGIAAMTVSSMSMAAEEKEDYSDIKVGVSWKTLQEQRWVTELNAIQATCDELGVEMIYQVSDNDTEKQIGQIQNLVSQDCDVIICVPSELEAMDNCYKDVHEAGVYLVNYEAVSGEVYCDMCGGLENYEVGKAITGEVADALKEDGGNVFFIGGDPGGGKTQEDFMKGMQDSFADTNCTIAGEQWSTMWDAAIAQNIAENWITQYGDDIAAICPMNDGMAAGVIKALEGAGLDGKVLVGGQDADLAACQRILAGTQYSTVYKNSLEAARLVTECAVKLAKGTLTEEDYGGKTTVNSLGEEVPFAAVEPVVVTKDNLDEVIIGNGIYTHEEVYGE